MSLRTALSIITAAALAPSGLASDSPPPSPWTVVRQDATPAATATAAPDQAWTITRQAPATAASSAPAPRLTPAAAVVQRAAHPRRHYAPRPSLHTQPRMTHRMAPHSSYTSPARNAWLVMRGQNLTGIAWINDLTLAQLVAANRAAYPSIATDPDLILAGWVLRIPRP